MGYPFRKNLAIPSMLNQVKKHFSSIEDDRAANASYLLNETLTAGLAMFLNKYSSVLHFINDYNDNEIIRKNYETLYGIHKIPQETQFRKIIDDVNSTNFRPIFKTLLDGFQESGELSKMRYLNGTYIIAYDGTGKISSENIKCDMCCIKNYENGKHLYYHQLMSGMIVHPDYNNAFPILSELIMKSDGAAKNDCEQNSFARLILKTKEDHPHLKVTVAGDALYADGPTIRRIWANDWHFVIRAKPTDLTFLFDQFDHMISSDNQSEYHIIHKGETSHIFRFSNGLMLNKSNKDIKVNLLEYWEVNGKGGLEFHSTWLTDHKITCDNVYKIMKAGRARWKIENEGFNNLKNHKYYFEHNYGHGEKNLVANFTFLALIAFFIDQIQRFSCKLFRNALKFKKKIKYLWESLRSLFENYILLSWEIAFRSLSTQLPKIILRLDSS